MALGHGKHFLCSWSWWLKSVSSTDRPHVCMQTRFRQGTITVINNNNNKSKGSCWEKNKRPFVLLFTSYGGTPQLLDHGHALPYASRLGQMCSAQFCSVRCRKHPSQALDCLLYTPKGSAALFRCWTCDKRAEKMNWELKRCIIPNVYVK